MKFHKDILISYAHIDDEVFIEGETGWITSFHRALEIRLAQLLGRKPIIWRDGKLQGNDDFGQEIVDQFPDIAILISIVSPRYIKSDWCVKEVREFSKVAQSGTGLQIQNKSRLFKVIKTPVPIDQHPEVMRDLLGYEFYQIDQQTGRAKEFGKYHGAESERAYWSKLDDIAHDITDLITLIETLPEDEMATGEEHSGEVEGKLSERDEGNDQLTVYLAETSYDLKPSYEMIKRELLSHGCRVLPDQQLPLIAPEFTEKLQQMLNECDLSIHLVGNHYGLVPEGTEKARGVLQNEIAAQQSTSHQNFQRLIWMPVDLQVEDERQKRFIELIQNDIEAQQGAEVLQTPLTELNFAIHDLLNAKKQSQEEPPPAPEDKAQVATIYLICDQPDLDHIVQMEDFLFEQGFEVIIPVFDGEEANIRLDHQENLKMCDGVILYYGESNELWVRAKVRELLKIAGYGRPTPLRHKMIYLVATEDPRKKRFRMQGIPIIREEQSFSPTLIHDFVQELK